MSEQEREIAYNRTGLDVGLCPCCGADASWRLYACDRCFHAHSRGLGSLRAMDITASRDRFYEHGRQLRAEGKMPPLKKMDPPKPAESPQSAPAAVATAEQVPRALFLDWAERWYTRGKAVETNAEANERILALVAKKDAELARLERLVQDAMLTVTRYLEWRRTESDGRGGAK